MLLIVPTKESHCYEQSKNFLSLRELSSNVAVIAGFYRKIPTLIKRARRPHFSATLVWQLYAKSYAPPYCKRSRIWYTSGARNIHKLAQCAVTERKCRVFQVHKHIAKHCKNHCKALRKPPCKSPYTKTSAKPKQSLGGVTLKPHWDRH